MSSSTFWLGDGGDVPASAFGQVLDYYRRQGWWIARQEPGTRDVVLCRQRPRPASYSVLQWLVRLLFIHGNECQRVWVEPDGLVHDEWVKQPRVSV